MRGVMLATVRKYLGVLDGCDAWELNKYIIGILNEDGKLIDYKTNESYKCITRNEEGCLAADRDSIEIGGVYAVEATMFDKNKHYSKKEIESFINESNLFKEDYKNKGKVLKKVKVIS